MKRISVLLSCLLPLLVQGQNYIGSSNVVADTTTRQYVQNSPSNTFGNRRDVTIAKDSTMYTNRYLTTRLEFYGSARNNGDITGGLAWFDANGVLQRSPTTSLSLSSGQVTGALGFTPYNATNPSSYITQSGARGSISLTTTGTSGAATYNSSTGVLNIPNYAVSSAPTINSNVSRSLSNAAGSTNQFTISASQNARVYYSLNVAWSITALVSTSSTILLEYSTNSGSSWIIVNQVSKNINLGLVQSGNDDLNVSGEIPANALVRIRPSVATNATITYVRGQEVLY